jgi:cytochrome c-type biogenesis protein CcmE
MSPQNKKRLVMVAALVLVGGALTYVAFGGIEKNLVYFWDVQELLGRGDSAVGATVRLGGVVEPGSFVWKQETLDLHFNVAMKPEKGGPVVAVEARGAPPQMFREGIGVVVEGAYDGKLFHADRVIVKHSNEYKPPANGERPQDIYKTLVEPET